jgi:3-deoxy-manno-octulosonate cytidylyltransferase (CMP-KDO synthetase)
MEQAESLEQLRFIWNSVAIHVADALESVPPGVDTEEDLQKVSKLIGSL